MDRGSVLQQKIERGLFMKRGIMSTIACGILATFALPAQAVQIMPDFDGAPTGWVTDRYDPHSFADIGTYQGRNNVLAIEITSAEGSANRGGQSGTFYNTQGKTRPVAGGIGDSLGASLYIPTSWSDEDNGSIRTDAWGVMTNGSTVTDYPIIGFTNYGGPARFRVWDDAVWVDLVTPVLYDEWNDLSFIFTGSAYEYSINGAIVYTDTTTNGTTGFKDVIMQAYNFDDLSITDATLVNYTVHWSNLSDEVPGPRMGEMLLLGTIGLFAMTRRNPLQKLK